MNVNLRYRSLLKVSGASQAVQGPRGGLESWILERVARACSSVMLLVRALKR